MEANAGLGNQLRFILIHGLNTQKEGGRMCSMLFLCAHKVRSTQK
jgi:hypothetical protein